MTMGEEKKGREGERATTAFVRAREKERRARCTVVRFVRQRSTKFGLNAQKLHKNSVFLDITIVHKASLLQTYNVTARGPFYYLVLTGEGKIHKKGKEWEGTEGNI